ncbi:MAG: transposase [Hydrococcus sp. Prado102]|jgi:IS605 OrfB family transposase|nr:transposase [Hydrococcus sp. Prado102]
MFGCQQVLIKDEKSILAVLEYLGAQSNKIYNCATYYARQVYLKTGKIINRAEICSAMVKNPHFGSMYVSSSQQTCNAVAEAFKSFQALNKLYKRGELEDKPSLPKYRKPKGMYTVAFPRRWLKLTDKGIRVPLGMKVKAWFGLDSFYLPMPTNLKFSKLKEIRFLPRNGCFYAEFIYQSEEIQLVQLDSSRALGIDHGLNNWLTCVDSAGKSFIVDGRKLKSENQWYNKRVAQLKEGKAQGFWSKQLANITEKRNRQMRDAVNKVARIVVNYCLENRIGKIVFGWNQRQKDSSNMSRKVNQEFVLIPTAKLKARIAQLCELSRIDFLETEESYTSKSSFLNNDFLPTYGEKPQEYKPSGKRIKRGLYKTAQGWLINADSNGAANILRKVAIRLGLNLSRISRGALTTPLRVQFWAT